MSTENVFRVTVRGRFSSLDERTRSFLEHHVVEHSIFNSAFTPEGTFVYDDRIQFFNLRYEIRSTHGLAGAESEALVEAKRFLSTLSIPHRGLKAKGTNVSALWDDARPG